MQIEKQTNEKPMRRPLVWFVATIIVYLFTHNIYIYYIGFAAAEQRQLSHSERIVFNNACTYKSVDNNNDGDAWAGDGDRIWIWSLLFAIFMLNVI